jgi:hypothetical protein
MKPLFRLGIPVFLSLFCGYLQPAGATDPALIAEVQKTMQQKTIPWWHAEASEVKQIRLNLPEPYRSMAETWKSLDNATNAATGIAPLSKATSPKDGNELMAFAVWLRWRILAENADPRYSYAYAFDVHLMKDAQADLEQTAVTFFFHARLAFLVDGARCIDRTSPTAIANEIEAQESMASLRTSVSKLTKREKSIAMLSAAGLELMRGERQPFSYLCTHGLDSMQVAMKSSSSIKQLDAEDPRASTHLGKTYAVDVSNVKPKLIPEDQWQKKRKEILDAYIIKASEGLMGAP